MVSPARCADISLAKEGSRPRSSSANHDDTVVKKPTRPYASKPKYLTYTGTNRNEVPIEIRLPARFAKLLDNVRILISARPFGQLVNSKSAHLNYIRQFRVLILKF